MSSRILLLDESCISAKLRRMAFEVWERLPEAKSITVVGIDGGGLGVAHALATILEEISGAAVEVHALKLDKRKPVTVDDALPVDISGKDVVLVDDVANSGKTLLYALRPLLAYEPARILLAVLVDRAHKSFPVTPDIVGHTVSTTLQEHIEVVCEGERVVNAYLH
jgi:pyrimidine operon attenuation protein/uracil phosphoribosyltransferase